ncbi:ABC transporter ATP-binding protein [Pseudonocardiaceae bacterium YIM PH 21723]|nr:ABC transporter ATP-binding protein [Pseudonocardiaceae bacterium YIM PH 21723]
MTALIDTEDRTELDAAANRELGARSRKLLFSLLRPYRTRVILTLVANLVHNMAILAGPLLIAAAIDRGVPAALRGDTQVLVLCGVAYAATSILSAALHGVFVMQLNRLGQDVLFDLRQRVFDHAQRLALSFHESYTSGRLISRMTNDLRTLWDLVDSGMDDMIMSLITMVGVAAVLITLDAPLALVLLLSFIPILLITRWYRRVSVELYRATSSSMAKAIVHFVESMGGVRVVQSFRREEPNERTMDGLAGEYQSAWSRSMVTLGTFMGSIRFSGNASIAIMLLIGAYQVHDGTLQLGVLTAFLIYLRRFYDPLDDIAMFANAYASASAAMEKISGVLATEPTVADPENPVPLTKARGEVRFTDVRFRYGPDTPQVLSTLDLHIPAGQTVALVGETGAGKSTVAKLVARFYDPSEGTVSLDGIDLRDLADTDLRRAVAMVTQESFLFSGSVADNIALGKPSASRAEIEAAAAAVGAHGFIAALPEGYDTDVRKRGGRLSAGQRQLVSFARALLADPAVLILDEATSSMDIPTERAVQSALETVLTGRTALIIAHRLSTVLIADRVLVVDGGAVTEDGAPEELIAQGGAFADLHRTWLDSIR